MARKIEISNEKYLELKQEVLDNVFIKRVDVKMNQIEIESINTIKLDGNLLTLSKTAITGMIESLGISKKFIETIKKGFGEDKTVLNAIVKAIKGKSVKGLTLVYNVKEKEITNIYPLGSKLIQDSQYFEALEKVIERTPQAYLRNITQQANGDLKAVIANPGLEFQFGNLPDECFTSGMTLNLNAHKMATSFFTERLICTNGMTTYNKLCSREVVTGDKVPDFLTAILDADYHLDSVIAFKRRLNRCYHTIASLKEVLEVDRRVNSLLGNYGPILTKEMSADGIKLAFGEKYLADTYNHPFLRTNMTLWELVNEITALSSRIEQHQIAVPERTNLSLQMLGGDLMFSKPDLSPSNIKQIF